MGQLTDIGYIKYLLEKNGTRTKKGLGQNFLVNPTVAPRMAESCIANGAKCVLEIGCGIGVLTKELSEVAEKVVCVEIDQTLFPILDETLAGCENVEIVHGDIMKTDIPALIGKKFGNNPVSVCANLPYYITSPVMMKLIEEQYRFESLTLMVQKEFAERITAAPGTSEYGALTVSAAYRAQSEILFGVNAGSFLPKPKVDSAVIKLKPYKTPPVEVVDENIFFRLIKASFSQRRKILANSVSSVCDKATVLKALDSMNISQTIRGEALSVEQFAQLSNKIFSLSAE